MSRIYFAYALAALCLGSAGLAPAQVAGPIEPPPKFEVKRIPARPNPLAPPMPAEEIIRRFTQNEDLVKKAYENQSFDQTVRVEELAENGGDFSVTGETYTKPDGKRYERIIKPPVSSLHYTAFSLEDVEVLARMPLFVLTTDELQYYNLTYEGQEKLDEINTYVFRVQPKHVMGNRRLFDGVVWVDQQDLAIVKSYGQFVTEVSGGGEPLPFKMFETYRENLVGNLWFPTYIRSDDFVTLPKGQVRLRLVIRSTNFKAEVAPARDEKPAQKPAAPKVPATPKT